MGVFEQALQLRDHGNITGALDLLEQGANSGDAGSCIELAGWYLSGRLVPRDLARANDFFRRGGELGNPDSRNVAIYFKAMGIGCTQDWTGAVEEARRHAQRDPGLNDQLKLIDRMAVDANGDPSNEISYEEVSVQPFVRTLPAFFSHDECDYLMSRARPRLKPSVVVDPVDFQLRPNPIRSSFDAGFPWVQEDLVIHALNRRMAKASGTKVMCGEPLNILRYSPGQEYLPHVDTFDEGDNQRVATMLVYLNGGYRGGETHFTRAGMTISGKKGMGLLFRNVLESGATDEMTQHAGRPVLSGEKYIASRWIRERPLVEV